MAWKLSREISGIWKWRALQSTPHQKWLQEQPYQSPYPTLGVFQSNMKTGKAAVFVPSICWGLHVAGCLVRLLESNQQGKRDSDRRNKENLFSSLLTLIPPSPRVLLPGSLHTNVSFLCHNCTFISTATKKHFCLSATCSNDTATYLFLSVTCSTSEA